MKLTPPKGKKFNGKVHGDEIELPERTARALIKANLLEEVVEPVVKSRRRYARRDMVAEGTAGTSPE